MVDFNDIKFKGKDENFNTLKGGIKRESITDTTLLNIFDKVDTDKNHVLDKNEINIFQQQVAKEAEHGRNSKLSKREAGKYLESLGVKAENTALFSFINKISSESSKVKSSTVNENGDSVTEYEDGTTETVQKDGSKIVKKGTTTTTYKLNENGEYEIQEEVFVDPKDGSETTTTYENGKKSTSIKEYPNGNIEEITYDESEKEQSKVVTKDNGKTEETYTYENGMSFLATKKENIGTDKEKITTFTKNPDGTITEKSEDSTGTREIIKKDGQIIKETVNNNDGSSYEKIIDGNKTTKTTVDTSGKTTVKTTEVQDGKTVIKTSVDGKETTQILESKGENTQETLLDSDNNKTVTLKNDSGKRLTQTYTDADTGKSQTVTYDGQGNTTGMVVQFGENAAKIAKKFGCSKEALLKANGKQPGEDFKAGETIIIPTEVDADNKYLKNRKSAEAIERAKQIDAQYRSMGLKNYQRSGEKFEYGGKTYTVIGTMKDRARLLVRDSKGNITVASHDNKILKDSYVKATNAFDHGEKVTGKARGQNGQIVDNGEYVRIGEKDKHGRSIVVDKNGKQWIMAHDGTLLKADYVAKSNRIDEVSSNSKTAQSVTADILDNELESATSAFEQQLAEDGWAGDVADGISILWGSENRASKVREDLAQYKQDIAALKKAAAAGDKEFAAKFKQIFGVDYNAHNIAVYEQYPTEENYRKAFGTKNNIAQRVTEYNQSQQTGAAVVKGTATIAAGIAIGVATGGTGLVALGAAAAGTAAASATINMSDRMSSDVGLQEGETTQILKDAAIDGAMTFAGGAIGKSIGTVVKGTTTMANVTKAAGNAVADVATGAAAEYMQTGEVTLEGTAMNAGMAMVGFGTESGAFKEIGKTVKNSLSKTKHSNTSSTANSSGLLDKLTKNNNNPSDVAPARSVGKLNSDKFKEVKAELESSLSNINSLTDDNLAKLQKQVDALQDRTQRRELEAMINKKKVELASAEAEAKVKAKTETSKAEEAKNSEKGKESEIGNSAETNPANDIKLKQKLGEKLHSLYVKIHNAIEQLKTFSGYNKLKSLIETNFSKFKEEKQVLLDTLNKKIKSEKTLMLSERVTPTPISNDNLISNPYELCREVGNNGKPVPPKYIKTSAEAREHLNNAIESGKYTESLESYTQTINKMHKISYAGKSGKDEWYSSAGEGENKINPGVIRSDVKGMRNQRVESALQVEEIAKRYGDSYRVSTDVSHVKLDGIPPSYLPTDLGGGTHCYPAGTGLKYYYKEMHRTAKEALELIDSGATKRQVLEKIAEHYQYAANARPYGQINNSLFMNEVNTLLKRAGMDTMPQGILDIAAMHLQPDAFKKYFIDQYFETALH